MTSVERGMCNVQHADEGHLCGLATKVSLVLIAGGVVNLFLGLQAPGGWLMDTFPPTKPLTMIMAAWSLPH